jgi:two-component system chemotaxis response regulator CheB
MTEVVLIKSAGAFNCLLSILRGMDKAIANSYCSTSAKIESNFESILQLNTHYTVKEIEDRK